MDLKALHSLMTKKGYYYFEGSTNTTNNNLYLSFSKGINGRGDAVDIRIGEIDNDIDLIFRNNPTNILMRNIDDRKLLSLIDSRC